MTISYHFVAIFCNIFETKSHVWSQSYDLGAEYDLVPIVGAKPNMTWCQIVSPTVNLAMQRNYEANK